MLGECGPSLPYLSAFVTALAPPSLSKDHFMLSLCVCVCVHLTRNPPFCWQDFDHPIIIICGSRH